MAKKFISLSAVIYIILCCAACSPQNAQSSPSSSSLTPSAQTAPTSGSTPAPTVIEQENPFEWLEEYDRGAVKAG